MHPQYRLRWTHNGCEHTTDWTTERNVIEELYNLYTEDFPGTRFFIDQRSVVRDSERSERKPVEERTSGDTEMEKAANKIKDEMVQGMTREDHGEHEEHEEPKELVPFDER